MSWKIKASDLDLKENITIFMAIAHPRCPAYLVGSTCMPGGKPGRSLSKVPRLSISPCKPNQGTGFPWTLYCFNNSVGYGFHLSFV